MPVVRFAYFQDLPTVTLTIEKEGLAGGVVRRLLVDSGFTGGGGILLSPADCGRFQTRPASPCDVSGAIQGTHRQVWVSCAIPEIALQLDLIAIAADLDDLSLPDEINGLVGLTFLNQFTRWGAERDATGSWEFVLEK